ncbi:unnamed protein product [Rotaria socialis]|uniref:Uncharacterized protein n=1 Tax=Rotaria socialis TaxID=392032 RepID=A0A821BV67_9BILA|nr:unnamed protein product [Rotaria socialis]CAF4596837.1 unnamed protein product [Rotaria socialis]
MIYILDSSVCLLLSALIFVAKSTTFYQNDYEPRVFDYIPLNCYDCLSYRDIILTQLTEIPAQSFANFNLGSRDTNMILNGQLKLNFQPYAFQSLVVRKPNRTLTITFAAPNSWLNITENTFNGLDLQPHSTLRLIIKFFYGCTFHKNSLSGIKMSKHSRLIIDISSVTQIIFQNNIFDQNDLSTSIDFIISRTDTILFEPHSFSSLNINSNQVVSFHFELISHINLKRYSFKSLQLHSSSSFRFYTLFLTRLTMDSYAFQNMSLDTDSVFNFTIHTLATCLCFQSYTFEHIHQIHESRNIRILFTLNNLRGLSFFTNAFSNLSLNHTENQLTILSDNPINDPNPIINFEKESFPSINSGLILLNFSSTTVVKFEQNSLQNNYLAFKIYLKDITLVDLSLLNFNLLKTKMTIHFDYVFYVKWFQAVEKNFLNIQSLAQFYFNYISNNSCLIYEAPRFPPWLFSNSNTTICNCPLLAANKHGKLDGQIIPCIRSMSGHETAQKMDECDFERKEIGCHSTLESLTDLRNNTTPHSMISNSLDIDNFLIHQLYDKNYLSCSFNYSLFRSPFIIRSRLFDNIGLIIGIILGVFIILLILVMALLNGLQYKIREYDETWTWRRNMSWTSLRRTLSQTSLRRSRRDLRTTTENVITSKSDNQLDRLRYEHADSDDQELDSGFIQTSYMNSSIQENLKKHNQI